MVLAHAGSHLTNLLKCRTEEEGVKICFVDGQRTSRIPKRQGSFQIRTRLSGFGQEVWPLGDCAPTKSRSLADVTARSRAPHNGVQSSLSPAIAWKPN